MESMSSSNTQRNTLSSKGKCEYKNQCDLYRESSSTCANSTSDEREYCGVYRKKCSNETLRESLSRGLENFFFTLTGRR